MRKLQRTRLVRYSILMIILVVSLLALRISFSNYNEIETYKEYIKEYAQKEGVVYTIN